MSIVRISATTSEKHTAWSGCDVAKATFDAGLWLPLPEGQSRPLRDIPVRTFPRTREGVREFLAWADGLIAPADLLDGSTWTFHAILEHTGRYSEELVVWLLAERPATRWTLLNPQQAAHFARSLAPRAKTDKTDARALTLYGLERRPVCDERISPERAELRDLSRYRTALVEMRTAEKNRAGESNASPLVRQLQQKHIAQLDREIERIEAKMHQLIRKLPDLHPDAELIDSIYGVGFVTAIAVVAELGDLRRFRRARQISAFVGLCPRTVRSGSSVHPKTRMSKAGEPRLRALLYMCATSAIVHNPHMKQVHDRLTAAGKTHMSALGAVMRKLLVLMRALVISGQRYQPDYQPCGKTQKNLGITPTPPEQKCA
jgi:transposase